MTAPSDQAALLFGISQSNREKTVIVFAEFMVVTETWDGLSSTENGPKSQRMKQAIALTAAVVLSQAIAVFAGETDVSAKQVIQPVPPLASYFGANEFDLGAFGTYDTSFNDNRRAVGDHAWGGGIGVTYFPWLYAGFGIDGSLVKTIPGDDLGQQIDGKFTLRYPLDLMFPNLQLAPYGYAGVGSLIVHTGGSNHHSSVLGNFGGGFEYRFTPLFSETGYEIVDGPKDNFMQVNFGLQYSF